MGILLTPLLVFHLYTPFGDVIRHLSWWIRHTYIPSHWLQTSCQM